jgi:hypothetical protein
MKGMGRDSQAKPRPTCILITVHTQNLSINSAASNASSSPLMRPQQEGVPLVNGAYNPKLHEEFSGGQGDDGSQKDSFLNYFFGGSSKQDRPALGPQDLISNAQYVPPLSMNNIIEAELEKKLEEVSMDGGEDWVAPHGTQNREDIETQLIRKQTWECSPCVVWFHVLILLHYRLIDYIVL